jgi:hypothetical protein
MSLYGNPAHGKAMTPKLIPIAAKNEMTHGVHPYVRMPNKTLTNDKIAGLALFSYELNWALENVNISVAKTAITTFTKILAINEPYRELGSHRRITC